MVSTDCDALMNWCHPGFAHMRWDSAHVVRRVVRWVAAVRNGKPDRKVINVPGGVRPRPGGSIGPVGKGWWGGTAACPSPAHPKLRPLPEPASGGPAAADSVPLRSSRLILLRHGL
jgi:hypothetical protein